MGILELVGGVGMFALGSWFQAKVLSKPTVQNVFKRFKQKKGADNIMTISNAETSPDVITIDTSPKETREIKKRWRQLKKTIKN